MDKALLWNILHEEPECPTRALLDKVAHMDLQKGSCDVTR
jgi:hypothetical protein